MTEHTTNKPDPIQARMQRGRKIAISLTVSAVAVFGLTAWIYPEMFQASLTMPTEEEREKAKKERRKQRNKPKRELSKEDIERIAKLRESKARKHLLEILRRLEKRIVIAENLEIAATEKFRDDPALFESLKGLMSKHAERVSSRLRAKSSAISNSGNKRYDYYTKESIDKFHKVQQQSYNLSYVVRNYISEPKDKQFSKMHSMLDEMLSHIEGDSDSVVDTQTVRYMKSIKSNSEAIQNKNRDAAVRGNAVPEDHPLDRSERGRFNNTISDMNMAQLHQLSQDMGEHYSNLMGDVEAADLAEEESISLPEALDKLAHEAYAKDDLQEELSQGMPETMDELDDFSDAQNQAQSSAEKALQESGGEVPPRDGQDPEKKPGGE